MVLSSHVTAIVANLVARGVVSVLVRHRRLGSIHIIFSKVGIGTELEYTSVSAGAVTKINFASLFAFLGKESFALYFP